MQRAQWLGLASAFAVGCVLVTDLDDLRAPDASTPIDAAVPDSGDTSHVIAQAGAIANETGDAQQAHLVYARASKRWVLFYITDGDTGHLLTRVSADFASWIDGAPLTLLYTHSSDGRELSVAYASLGGADVVHVAMSHVITNGNRRHTHTRALVQGDTITFGTPELVALTTAAPATQVDPNAPATIVTADGVVVDASGWADYADGGSYFNANLFVAAGKDDGVTFASGGWTTIDLEKTVRHVNSRALLEVPPAIQTYWDIADVKPDPTNVHGADSNGPLVWSSPTAVFGDAGENENDWSVAYVAQTSTVHAVRYTPSIGFEHLERTGATWTAGAAIPATTRAAGSGLVLLSDGANLLVATLAVDGTPLVSRFSGAWSAWTPVVSTVRSRSFLSGSVGAGSAALVWTEVGTSGYEVVGTLVAF